MYKRGRIKIIAVSAVCVILALSATTAFFLYQPENVSAEDFSLTLKVPDNLTAGDITVSVELKNHTGHMLKIRGCTKSTVHVFCVKADEEFDFEYNRILIAITRRMSPFTEKTPWPIYSLGVGKYKAVAECDFTYLPQKTDIKFQSEVVYFEVK